PASPGGVALGDGEEDSPDSGNAPRPDVVWDSDPAAPIVSGTFCCGFTSELVPINYIPDFQVWGDGRIVWVEYDESGGRRVLEAQFSANELSAVLQQAVDAGFFGWKERYENLTITDMADKCLTINLVSDSKTVCEYFEGAPQEFHNLYDLLARGAGLDGDDYVPESGYLVAHVLAEFTLSPISEDDVIWPADTLFSLQEAVDKGIWVEEEALELAWEAVNKDPWGVVVREGGSTAYQLSVQIPGLNMTPPPER
ncbi:MAG: hypothetical protein ACE5GO_07495, partial [Anaerolineales bacterium]